MVLVMLVMVVGVCVVPGPQGEGEKVISLGRLQAKTDRLSPVLAVMVERQQRPHCVLPHSPPLITHLELIRYLVIQT